ncbi:MAG: membrane protein insertion efficiency factor YidD [Candidatus Omnitrophota bacterium]|nr:membrane protein insertion efficiency factor YidD [Candidatus Omnitrophota bacterium]
MSRVSQALVYGIRAYRQLISPWLGNHCRFYPSCSSYGEEAIVKKGASKGVKLLAMRLFKCHPFHPGGLDPVE